ncbi:hypothetical protein DV737_g2993, partial [Chaetothyriales sp. CBS 132003]
MSVEGGDDALEYSTTSRAPWYGEGDNSPTTDRELKGWYCYGIAAEVFAVTGTGSFLPVTIEQLARENGVLYSDRKTPCVGATTNSRDTSVPETPASNSQSSTSPALQLSNKISARGVGLGYVAAVFVQVCSILILFLASKVTTDRTIPLRIVLFVAGLWWFIFSIPTAFWLRNRPGPPLPSSFTKQKYASSRFRLASSYVIFAWSSVYGTLKLALGLSQVRLFLLAWFLLSDATTTVASTAILFARTELGLTPVGIACLSITATCSGIGGAVLWPIISRRLGWNTNRTIMACLCLTEIIPLYGLLSLIPAVQRLGWLGLQQYWEIFPLAVIHGVAMGGFSSYCRSLFGQLIPPGHEASFYALFAITDKGSSAVGPAVVGRIVDITGSIRPSFWFLLVLVGLPIFIVGRVNEVRGRHEAVRTNVVDEDDDPGIELSASASEGRDREQREALIEGQ